MRMAQGAANGAARRAPRVMGVGPPDGCHRAGYYTRFFPDPIAKAFSLAGDRALLERARQFWHYGSKRGYRTTTWSAGPDAVGQFATHVPPKDDSVLSTSRMFHEWAHPRRDLLPPEPVRDLTVVRRQNGQAEIRFTAPRDAGGGRVVRYQVKCAELPIVGDNDFDFARDHGVKRNAWRASNLTGEPAPAAPGTAERFVVAGVPGRRLLHFVVAGFDDASNRSPWSNVAVSRPPLR
ncbi:MAG: hypothetical protein JXQ71_16010 [Verrucomicrobia bacterium]|nr:hypothetical protein [Verrucomicrobiota bacterium]